MRMFSINNPSTEAEGLCNGLPYTTQTYDKNGCTIHFWVRKEFPNPASTKALNTALHKAVNARDIVVATWSLGEPSGFWAHEDIE